MAFVQLVTFELCGEEYGIDINSINGIVKSKSYKVIKVPNSPKYLEGIINLRGRINPIFNLKKKFHMDDKTINEDSKIIIVNNEEATVGFIVDEVTDIFKLNDDDIESVPGSINGNDRAYIKGIANFEDRIILILDLIKTMSDDEVQQLRSISDMDMQ
jgi:purine-binding chemotaxis protein CheW